MAATGAERRRLCRQRQGRGLRVFHPALPDNMVTDRLIAAGLISADDSADPALVDRALEKWVLNQIKRHV